MTSVTEMLVVADIKKSRANAYGREYSSKIYLLRDHTSLTQPISTDASITLRHPTWVYEATHRHQ